MNVRSRHDAVQESASDREIDCVILWSTCDYDPTRRRSPLLAATCHLKLSSRALALAPGADAWSHLVAWGDTQGSCSPLEIQAQALTPGIGLRCGAQAPSSSSARSGAVTLPAPNAALGSLLPPPSSAMLTAHHHHHGGLPDPHDQPPIACDRDWDLVARVRKTSGTALGVGRCLRLHYRVDTTILLSPMCRLVFESVRGMPE